MFTPSTSARERGWIAVKSLFGCCLDGGDERVGLHIVVHGHTHEPVKLHFAGAAAKAHRHRAFSHRVDSIQMLRPLAAIGLHRAAPAILPTVPVPPNLQVNPNRRANHGAAPRLQCQRADVASPAAPALVRRPCQPGCGHEGYLGFVVCGAVSIFGIGVQWSAKRVGFPLAVQGDGND